MSRHRTTVLPRLQALLATTVLLASTVVAVVAAPAQAANNPAATVTCGAPATTVGTLRAAIVACAKAQLGGGSARVAESPAGSNCNPYAFALGRPAAESYCASGTHSDEWCADTSDWIWANALPGATMAAKEGQIPGWSKLTALASSFETWAKAEGTWHDRGTYSPQPGDAVVFGGTGHVGIVISVASATSITIVAGNSGAAVSTAYGKQNVDVDKETGNPATWNVGTTKAPELVVGYAEPKTTLPTGTANQPPIGSLDSVTERNDSIEVTGWTADPDYGTSVIGVQIYIDGPLATADPAGNYRADVAAAYPALGGNHGYTIDIPEGTAATHNVCAYGLDATGGPSTQLGCKSVLISSGLPFGSLDSVTGTAASLKIVGWSIDPDAGQAAINVDVYIDGVMNQRTLASVARSDVGAAYPVDGPNHGYSTIASVSAGTHTVCTYGLNTGPAGSNPQLACRTVTV